MATINLTGLPVNCKLPKLVFLFKRVLKRDGIGKFWIKEMADIRGTDFKSANVEFYAPEDAYRALKILDGFVYNSDNFDYPISARLENEERRRPRRRSPSPNYRLRDYEFRDRYEEPHYSRYSRDRSRSPVSRESSKLDLEIELLRKQRMIIEEERRILLERKKLELVKEFGPSALKEFKYLEEDRERDRERDRDRRFRAERLHEYRPRRRSPPPVRPRNGPAPRSKLPKERSQLPQFHLPCKILLGELKETMETLGTRKESFLLTKLIRATIRKQLAVLLEDKPIMSGAKIVALYREKYPTHQDEDFVKKHLKDLRACHLPSEDTEIKENTGDEGSTVKEEEQQNNGVCEKEDAGTTKTVDIKTVQEGGTDAKVKEEPNTSIDETQVDTHEDQVDGENQIEKADCGLSVGSSEAALALHDKNDEDWVEGENDWDDTNAQAAQD